MRAVFAIPAGKRKELAALLEADPYAEGSFARAGYKMKDGAAIGENAENIYVYIKADEGFLKSARGKLGPLLAEIKKEDEDRIAEKIEKEEAAAEGGFGAIFG